MKQVELALTNGGHAFQLLAGDGLVVRGRPQDDDPDSFGWTAAELAS